jgi:SAM-dependent methyltransferase
MKRALLDILACPACHGSLACTAEGVEGEDVLEGVLECRNCRVAYPVRRGIPRFVDDDNYAASFGLQWNRFRTTQLDSASGAGLSAARFRSETGWTPEWLDGKLVLDAGCGAGRFLEIAAEAGAQVVGLDISSAVDAARVNVARFPNAHLVQASLYAPPFRPGVFDACYCIGVLQHTPDPRRTLESLPRVLKDGGRVVVVAYERKAWTRLSTKYLIRPLTRRMTKPALLSAIRWSMPVLFAATELLFRIPLLGRAFRFLIPVSNYTGERSLSMRDRYHWAILDTFDALSPAFDQPQTAPEVTQALAGAGIVDIRRRPAPGVTVEGTKASASRS